MEEEEEEKMSQNMYKVGGTIFKFKKFFMGKGVKELSVFEVWLSLILGTRVVVGLMVAPGPGLVVLVGERVVIIRVCCCLGGCPSFLTCSFPRGNLKGVEKDLKIFFLIF